MSVSDANKAAVQAVQAVEHAAYSEGYNQGYDAGRKDGADASVGSYSQGYKAGLDAARRAVGGVSGDPAPVIPPPPIEFYAQVTVDGYLGEWTYLTSNPSVTVGTRVRVPFTYRNEPRVGTVVHVSTANPSAPGEKFKRILSVESATAHSKFYLRVRLDNGGVRTYKTRNPRATIGGTRVRVRVDGQSQWGTVTDYTCHNPTCGPEATVPPIGSFLPPR